MNLSQQYLQWADPSYEKLCSAFAIDFDHSKQFIAVSLRFDNSGRRRSMKQTHHAISQYISELLFNFDNQILGTSESRGNCRTSVVTSIEKMEYTQYWKANIILQVAWIRIDSLEDVISCLYKSFHQCEELDIIDKCEVDWEYVHCAPSVLSIAGLNPRKIDANNTFLTKYK